MNQVKIALDAMGGDYGCQVVVPAAIYALKKHSELMIELVGDEQVIKSHLKELSPEIAERLTICHASEQVLMDELPSNALRKKKNSSMRVAIDNIKSGKVQAMVSAGNTGALMATAKFVLKTLPGIDRPAIISDLPTMQGKTRVLDLGANVDSNSESLLQFAIMGSVLASAVDKIEKPTIGLLNIGVEEIKGNDLVKRTAHLLSNNPDLNYTGYIEGDDIYKGTINIVVCDGFVGNVALKASEGLSRLLLSYIKEAFNKNWLTKLLGFMVQPIFNDIRKKVDPSYHNGASLLGLNGIVIKSHGGADIQGFARAIEKAMLEVKNNVPDMIREQVSRIITEGV